MSINLSVGSMADNASYVVIWNDRRRPRV